MQLQPPIQSNNFDDQFGRTNSPLYLMITWLTC